MSCGDSGAYANNARSATADDKQRSNNVDLPDELAIDMLKPLDDDNIEFLIQLAEDVTNISFSEEPTAFEREILRIASSNILRLIAMSVAGYQLYDDNYQLARNLHHEAKLLLSLLEQAAPHVVAQVDLKAIKEYEDYQALKPEDFVKEMP